MPTAPNVQQHYMAIEAVRNIVTEGDEDLNVPASQVIQSRLAVSATNHNHTAAGSR
jgi:hypothetical protein